MDFLVKFFISNEKTEKKFPNSQIDFIIAVIKFLLKFFQISLFIE